MITQNDLASVITDTMDLIKHHIYREGFVFTSVCGAANVFDGIVIRHPADADCRSPKVGYSSRSLEEHIEAINKYGIKKALVIAENIDFLKRCPELEYLHIAPAKTAPNGFDYSPLYDMPNISFLDADTIYGARDELSTTLDHSRINGLQELYIRSSKNLNFQKVRTLKELDISEGAVKTIADLDLPELLKLTIIQCGITSLAGIENCKKLQWLSLDYMRSLTDISALASLAPTLRSLSFENCPKITDFSVIAELKNLEYLVLKGKNELPSLDFIKELPKLKFLSLTMNVLDGDVECLKNIGYVDAVCKRHYNLKSRDLPKDRTNLGFEFI